MRARRGPYAAGVQEFRPASVIAADTELAQRLESRDPVAIRSLVERYGPAVTASAVSSVGREAACNVAFDVFVAAGQDPLAPGDDFAPWLAGIVAERAGAVDEQRWELAMAISAIDPAARVRLREHHLDGPVELDDELAPPRTPPPAAAVTPRHDRRGRCDRSPIRTCGVDVGAGFVERVVEAVLGGARSAPTTAPTKRPAEVSRVTRGLRPYCSDSPVPSLCCSWRSSA